MFFNRFKIIICILLLFILSSFLIPIYSYSIDKNSIYVWSNNLSTITTSNAISQNELDLSENTRKFFKYNFW